MIFSYLETGELSQTIDPYEKETNYFYDNLGQLIKRVGTRGEVVELVYDANGNLVQEIRPLMRILPLLITAKYMKTCFR